MSASDKFSLAIGLAGAASVTTGAALLHPAAGWITGGGFALAWSYLMAKATGLQKGR